MKFSSHLLKPSLLVALCYLGRTFIALIYLHNCDLANSKMPIQQVKSWCSMCRAMQILSEQFLYSDMIQPPCTFRPVYLSLFGFNDAPVPSLAFRKQISFAGIQHPRTLVLCNIKCKVLLFYFSALTLYLLLNLLAFIQYREVKVSLWLTCDRAMLATHFTSVPSLVLTDFGRISL